MSARFRVARNPDAESRLPYLVWLPLDGGLVLKAREPWPRAARVFCLREDTTWDESGEMVDEADVVLCRRRGAAIDLVLDRPKLARSQFVFTTTLTSFAPSPAAARGWPTCSGVWRCGIRRCRSCSRDLEGSRRSGPTASSVPPSATAWVRASPRRATDVGSEVILATRDADGYPQAASAFG